METYQVYFLMGLLLVGLEIVVPGFVLAPLGVATLVTAGVAWLSPNLMVHGLSFLAASVAAFLCVKKFAHLVSGKTDAEYSSQLEFGVKGKQVALIAKVTNHANPGRVKLFADEFDIQWQGDIPAEALDWELGTQLKVTEVLGNKVFVER